MRYHDVHIRSTGVWLPPRRALSELVAAGECPPALPARTDMPSVAISEGDSGPEMAVRAAKSALARADSGPSDVDIILHADTYYQGHDAWAVASYIQRLTVANQRPALEIRQMSNGALAALDLAAAYLVADPGRRDALVTTGDRYCPPGFDRWRVDPGTAYADGGTAAVLSRRGGFARLVSLSMHSDSELEPMHRGDDPFGDAPLSHRTPIDFDDATKAFTKAHGVPYSLGKLTEGQSVVIKHALADAEMDLADAAWVVLPNFGRLRLQAFYYDRFDIAKERTAWEWGRTVGHLGAGDQIGGLDHLVASGRAVPGDRVVLIGIGAGYSWGCAVLEITDTPAWAGSASAIP